MMSEQEKQRLATKIVATLALFVFPSVMISVAVPQVFAKRTDQAAVYIAMALGGTCGSLVGGVLARRGAMLSVLRHAISAASVSFLLLACASLNGPGLVLVFFAYTAITAAGVAGLTLLPLLRPAAPRHTLSLSLASSALAGVVFPIVASGILSSCASHGVPIERAFSLGLLLTSIAFFFARLLLSGEQVDSISPVAAPSFRLSRAEWKLAGVAGALGALHAATDTTLSNWSMLHFTTSFNAPSFPPALILSGCAIAYFVTRLGLAFVPEQRGGRWLLIAPGVAGAGLLWLSFSQHAFVSAAWTYVLAAAFYGLEYPVLLGCVARLSPRCMGPVIAISTVSAYVLGALANLILGAVASHYDSARAAIALLPFGFLAFSLLALVAFPAQVCESRSREVNSCETELIPATANALMVE